MHHMSLNQLNQHAIPQPLEHTACTVDLTGNPYIKDKLTRLAEDGSKKMPNTLKEAVSSSFSWLEYLGQKNTMVHGFFRAYGTVFTRSPRRSVRAALEWLAMHLGTK